MSKYLLLGKEFSLSNTKVDENFISPNLDNLKENLEKNKRNLSYNAIYNWKILNEYLGSHLSEKVLGELYKNLIFSESNVKSNEYLDSWLNVLNILNNKYLNDFVQENRYLNLENIEKSEFIDSRKELLEKNLELFEIETKLPNYDIISSVNMSGLSFAKIIKSLGSKIDVNEINERDQENKKLNRYFIRNKILEMLTKKGYNPKKNISKEIKNIFRSDKNIINEISEILEKYSKNMFEKFISLSDQENEQYIIKIMSIKFELADERKGEEYIKNYEKTNRILNEIKEIDSNIEEKKAKKLNKEIKEYLKTFELRKNDLINDYDNSILKDIKEIEIIMKKYNDSEDEEDIKELIEFIRFNISEKLGEKILEDLGDDWDDEKFEEVEELVLKEIKNKASSLNKKLKLITQEVQENYLNKRKEEFEKEFYENPSILSKINEKAEKEKELPKTESVKVLRSWQKKMIKNIIKYKNSVIVRGPTGGGKTYAAMIIFSNFFKVKDTRMIYMAPNYHLALQIYSNVKETFPDDAVSFITETTSIVQKDTRLFIGTPVELWSYLSTLNLSFEIGIFDEIHNISSSFGIGKESKLRAESISNLLGLCPNQIIALSATIRDDDLKTLKCEIKKRTGIKKIINVIYNKRPVVIKRYIFDGKFSNEIPNENFLDERQEDPFYDDEDENEDIDDDLCEEDTQIEIDIQNPVAENTPIEKEENLSGDNVIIEENGFGAAFEKREIVIDENTIQVDPPHIFNLLSSIVDLNRLPAILFFNSENGCFNHFVEYTNWVREEDRKYVKSWYYLQDILTDEIVTLNEGFREVANNYIKAEQSKNEATIKEVSSRIDPLTKTRFKKINSVIATIEKEIIKILKEEANDSDSQKYTKVLQPREQKVLEEITSKKYETITFNCLACLEEYIKWRKLLKGSGTILDSIAELPMPFKGINRFFKIGKDLKCLDGFKSMIDFSDNEDKNIASIRKTTDELCKAERISRLKLINLIKLIINGLEYGIAIILPTLPFVLQYQILKSLKDTNNASPDAIKCIFSSHSMGAGVDYAIRTSVIINNYYEDLNVSVFNQMGGRCGRPGLDTEGHIISWNVRNAEHTTLADLPPIIMPEFGLDKGCYVVDSKALITSMETLRFDKFNIDVGMLGQMNYNFKIEEDDFGDNIYDIEQKIEKKKGRGKKLMNKNAFVENVDVELSALAIKNMINECVNPICIYLGFEISEIIQITNIINGYKNNDSDTYKIVRRFNYIKNCIREIHTKYHNKSNKEWLKYIYSIYRYLHRFQYMQMAPQD